MLNQTPVSRKQVIDLSAAAMTHIAAMLTSATALLLGSSGACCIIVILSVPSQSRTPCMEFRGKHRQSSEAHRRGAARLDDRGGEAGSAHEVLTACYVGSKSEAPTALTCVKPQGILSGAWCYHFQCLVPVCAIRGGLRALTTEAVRPAAEEDLPEV